MTRIGLDVFLDIFVYGVVGIDCAILHKAIYPQNKGASSISSESTVADRAALSSGGTWIIFL